jgi:probable F420-dependent oxidoreductase
MSEPLKFIAPMPRLNGDGAAWVSELRRLEALGFDTVAISQHVTKGWQLGLVAAMAFAAASTARLRVLSLVAQNDLHHPALLAKDIATIDALSGGRVELGLGTGWQADDYTALGLTFNSGGTRIGRLAEALEIIRRYFAFDSVDFAGDHYQITNMEALPRCVQRPNPPILVGAGSPRMLELAGRTADIVGIHAGMSGKAIDRTAIADLTAGSIEAKIERVRAAAAAAGRSAPRFQFSCYVVRVTDSPESSGPRSSWASHVEAQADVLRDSPAILVGTAAECADRVIEWSERFGISYWNLGPDVDAASRILDRLSVHGRSGTPVATSDVADGDVGMRTKDDRMTEKWRRPPNPPSDSKAARTSELDQLDGALRQ